MQKSKKSSELKIKVIVITPLTKEEAKEKIINLSNAISRKYIVNQLKGGL